MIQRQDTAGAQLATATAAKSGSSVTAVINGVTTTVQVARDLTVATGDVLVVSKVGQGNRGQWFALGRAYTAAPAYLDPDNAIPPPTTFPGGRLTIAAIFSGTFHDGAWETGRDDVAQGVYGGAGNATGVALYGYKAQALAGATVLGASVSITRIPGGPATASAATLQKVQDAVYPGNGVAPTLLASTAGPSLAPGDTTEFVIPTSWAQDMVNGVSGGLGVFVGGGTPYLRFGGRRNSATAWLLTIDWTR